MQHESHAGDPQNDSTTDPMESMRQALERKLGARQGKGPGHLDVAGGSRVGKGRLGSNGGPRSRRSGHR